MRDAEARSLFVKYIIMMSAYDQRILGTLFGALAGIFVVVILPMLVCKWRK